MRTVGQVRLHKHYRGASQSIPLGDATTDGMGLPSMPARLAGGGALPEARRVGSRVSACISAYL